MLNDDIETVRTIEDSDELDELCRWDRRDYVEAAQRLATLLQSIQPGPEVMEAMERLERLQVGESRSSVYPDSQFNYGDECSTSLTDTETLADFALDIITKLKGDQ